MGLLIVSGLSGAGKSQAVHALEDIGYFCIDNLPPALLYRFVEFSRQSGNEIEKLAVVMDVRGGEEYGGLEEALEQLRQNKIPFQCLFLDARDEVQPGGALDLGGGGVVHQIPVGIGLRNVRPAGEDEGQHARNSRGGHAGAALSGVAAWGVFAAEHLAADDAAVGERPPAGGAAVHGALVF